jgi:hypothetical protein
MHLDPVLLSRLQFAWVIGWHILLPAFTVGMGSFIAMLKGLQLAPGRDVYVRISTFWIKILAIAFGMGVVTGDRRLVRHRGRAPTVDRPRDVAHGRLGVAVADQLRRWVFRGKVHSSIG